MEGYMSQEFKRAHLRRFGVEQYTNEQALKIDITEIDITARCKIELNGQNLVKSNSLWWY